MTIRSSYSCSQKFKYSHHGHGNHANIELLLTSLSCSFSRGRMIVQHAYLIKEKQEFGSQVFIYLGFSEIKAG